MSKSRAERAAVRFKQLSCFGLKREVAIPEMLRELHELVPSFSNTFHFADARGNLENIYFENTDLVKFWPLYQSQIFERPQEREFKGLAFSDASRNLFGVHELRSVLSVDEETFHRSDYYNLVVRQVGYASNFLRLYFRRQGTVLGGLTVWRAPSGVHWSHEDKRRLRSLESFFIHAVTARPATESPTTDSGDRGLVIADTSGKPVYLSAEGRRLLFLATNPRSIQSGTATSSPALPPSLVALCQKLSRIFADDDEESAPTLQHSNVWGGFTFRAEWLQPDAMGSGLVGITISHQVPLEIRLTRGAAKFALSRRQAEICVLLAAGVSNEAIATRLNISRHTANEHARWIYNKLDVHSRAELLSKVLLT